MRIQIGISNRHVHLTEEDFKILFGNDSILENIKDLKQPGQYASGSKVDIETEKNMIKGLRVLGPLRNYTQVELSKTDSYSLGINPPVRESGNLNGASTVTIIGPNGKITKPCAIIANRHIHIDHKTREELGLLNIDEVQVRVEGEKGVTFEHVSIKEQEPSYFEMHLDTDDANAALIKQDDFGTIIKY